MHRRRLFEAADAHQKNAHHYSTTIGVNYIVCEVCGRCAHLGDGEILFLHKRGKEIRNGDKVVGHQVTMERIPIDEF